MPSAQLISLHVHPVKSATGVSPAEAAVEPWGLAGDRRWMVTDADGTGLTQREVPALARTAAAYGTDGAVELRAPDAEPLTVAVPSAGRTTPVRLFGQWTEAVDAGDEAAKWWSAVLGGEHRLVHLDDPAVRRPIRGAPGSHPGPAGGPGTVSFADSHPLLLTSTASLAALNDLIARGPNAAEGPLPMARFRPNAVIDGAPAWAEDGWRRVRLGDVVLRVAQPCARCVITTVHPPTGHHGREPLRTLARHRRVGTGLMFGVDLIPETPGTLRVGDAFSVVE